MTGSLYFLPWFLYVNLEVPLTCEWSLLIQRYIKHRSIHLFDTLGLSLSWAKPEPLLLLIVSSEKMCECEVDLLLCLVALFVLVASSQFPKFNPVTTNLKCVADSKFQIHVENSKTMQYDLVHLTCNSQSLTEHSQTELA